MVSRIKQLLDWQQLSSTQFADRIGVGRPVVSHILSERNKPSLEVMRSIKAAFPELSLDWLLNGSGSMLAAADTAGPLTTPSEVVASPGPASPSPLPASAREPAPAEEAPAPAPAAPPLAPAPPAEIAVVLPGPAAPAPARFRTGTPVSQVAAASPEASPVNTANSARPAVAPLAGPRATTAAAEPTRPAPQSATRLPPPAAEAPAAQEPALVPPAPPSPAPPAAAEAALLAGSLAEPGKAIRRIVIFYRDGSFADYQPE